MWGVSRFLKDRLWTGRGTYCLRMKSITDMIVVRLEWALPNRTHFYGDSIRVYQIQMIKRLINSVVFKHFLIVIRCLWKTDSSYCLGYCLKYLYSKVSDVTDCSSANQNLRLTRASSKWQRVGNSQRVDCTRQ